jgi:hypothetical protein
MASPGEASKSYRAAKGNGEQTMWQKLTLLAIALVFVGLVAHRVWRSAELPMKTTEAEMPARVGEAEERELHLVPGGKYTRADIEANGRTVPSQKYRGFQARHDYNPRPGDQLCPVTRTKASPDCSWTIGGRAYQFCCPPCIDEFVRLAKQHPDRVFPPETYVK